MELAQNELTTKNVIDNKAKDLPLLTRTNNGMARYCDKCKRNFNFRSNTLNYLILRCE